LLKHRDAISGRTVYPRLFILGIVDMLFTDIILLFVRVFSIAYIFLTFQQAIIYPLIFITMIYLLNELIVIMTAALFSPNKSDLKYVYLVPVMIFIYRPVYACIRFYAYIVSALKKDIKW
jgi:hypothetical protein